MSKRRLPVIIRRVKASGELIAFFPSLPWTRRGRDMTSYMLIGQHGAAYRDFYEDDTTRPENMGSPEVTAFLRHLRGIYETGDQPTVLVLRERLHPAYFRRLERPA